MTKVWVWAGAPKRERRKSRNESAKIFPQRAENQSAESTKAPKYNSPISSALITKETGHLNNEITEYGTSKSLLFIRFRYSDVQYSDPNVFEWSKFGSWL